MSAVLKTIEVPDELDWREYGKRSKAKNLPKPLLQRGSVSTKKLERKTVKVLSGVI